MGNIESELEALRLRVAALEETRLMRLRRALRRNKRAVAVAVTAVLLLPVAIYAAAGVIPFAFTAGNAAVASQVNANFTYLNNVAVPIGGIIGWHQDLAGVPALPGTGEWVKCDGQTLSDTNSPMDGQVIPNLNGNGLGANSPGHTAKVQMFLRGGTTSGAGQTDAFQGHWHNFHFGNSSTSLGGGYIVDFPIQTPTTANITADRVRAAISDGTNGTPRTASETRPANMSVVWIMRVK